MTLRMESLSMFRRDGEIERFVFDAPLILVTGPRNSGKTTLLKAIDFVLGASGSGVEELGRSVVDRYSRLELVIATTSGPHLLQRYLDRAQGLLTKIYVDEQPMEPREFTEWLMGAIDWPELRIPKAVVGTMAREEVPLTFRGLLRHMYRREDSWSDFASQEQEFMRRAALAFFLGFAEDRYSGVDFRVAEAERRLAAAEAQEREAVEALSTLSGSLLRNLSLTAPSEAASDPMSAVALLQTQLRNELAVTQTDREALGERLRPVDPLDQRLSAEYAAVTSELEAATAAASALTAAIRGYTDSHAFATTEIERLTRAKDSVGVFDAVPVTSCPACDQPITAARRRAGDAGTCYVCSQQVVPDARDARIDLEIRAIRDEIQELAEVKTRTTAEVLELAARAEGLRSRRDEIASRIRDSRGALIAPYVSQLENLSRRIGALEQQIAALQGVAPLVERTARARSELSAARRNLDIARGEWQHQQSRSVREGQVCSRFADRMNTFLTSLRIDPWRLGGVTLTSEELTFYIGTQPWDQTLGGESRVLFFFAYQYALVYLGVDGLDTSRPPGMTVLDNPIQQGLPDLVIGEVLSSFAAAAEATNSQVIATVAREVPIVGKHSTITLSTQFGGDDMALDARSGG